MVLGIASDALAICAANIEARCVRCPISEECHALVSPLTAETLTAWRAAINEAAKLHNAPHEGPGACGRSSLSAEFDGTVTTEKDDE